MTWMQLEGHDQIAERFQHCLASGRLGSAYLFAGPEGIGKFTFALQLARCLLCCETSPDTLEACHVCPACQQVLANTHPDLSIVKRPEDRNVIPIETFIGPRERRLREGLCHWIALKPTAGGRRIAIIDNADDLNLESANSLLKTLEEPPPRSLLILIAANPSSQLPTIRSRCQTIHFQPLEPSVTQSLLRKSGIGRDTAHASWLASMCGGSLARARQLNDPAFMEFRQEWYRSVVAEDPDRLQLVAQALEFVDAAGKDAPARRTRLNLVIDLSRDLYRHAMRAAVGMEIHGDETLVAAVQSLIADPRHDAETLSAMVECCIMAQQWVDAFAQPQTTLECWLSQLGTLTRHGHFAALDTKEILVR